jgi:hypothetical protein
MGEIKALLVGVCEYPALGCAPLPLCKNDLYALRNALINGINVNPKNILLCGETGKVTSEELICSAKTILLNVTSEDTFIFYFSGHGGKDCLVLSDNLIGLQDFIDTLEKVKAKNKIIILDCCHSGGFSINGIPQIDITDTVESFAGHGYAVLASCGAEQLSGFNIDRKISLYTSFLCDALTSRYLIRKGKKSLEIINESIFHYSNIWNKKNSSNMQQPIFRSNIGGTIFFEVEEYTPYKTNEIYEETDNYIIYKVEPLHNGLAKRLVVKVILRFQSTLEQIADISMEIKGKALYYEVYNNDISEVRHRNKAANMIFCHFGYDEDDMINGNFYCRTTWVDDLQDKSRWYRTSKNTTLINGVHIEVNASYEMIKSLKDDIISKDELIALTRKYTSKMISIAEQYIKLFREYLNNTITEEQLINATTSYNNQIIVLFLKQSDLPIPPNDLHTWANVHTKISSTIHDFSLYYNKNNLATWSTENRKWLMSDAIKRYEEELEELNTIEKTI